MSTSAVLQGIMTSYMSLSRTDTLKLTKDMSLALNEQEQASMPKIQEVQKIVFCSERNITPHISVYFVAQNGAEYCWDLSIKLKKKWSIESSESVNKYEFFGSLTLMKMPDEVTKTISGEGRELPWQINN